MHLHANNTMVLTILNLVFLIDLGIDILAAVHILIMLNFFLTAISKSSNNLINLHCNAGRVVVHNYSLVLFISLHIYIQVFI